jgi:hypothetical protein
MDRRFAKRFAFEFFRMILIMLVSVAIFLGLVLLLNKFPILGMITATVVMVTVGATVFTKDYLRKQDIENERIMRILREDNRA